MLWLSLLVVFFLLGFATGAVIVLWLENQGST